MEPVLPGSAGKAGGAALSDSRGIPRGPCADPSDPPAAPRNPAWGPNTAGQASGSDAPSQPGLLGTDLGGACSRSALLGATPQSCPSRPTPGAPPLRAPPSPRAQARAVPQLPLPALFFLDLGVQSRNPLPALLQNSLLPGKRQAALSPVLCVCPLENLGWGLCLLPKVSPSLLDCGLLGGVVSM